MDNIKFSLTLKPSARKTETKDAIIRSLERKGVRHTASGMTSLSFVCEREIFQTVFKAVIPDVLDKKSRTQKDVGATGVLLVGEPVVPDELKESVASVSVAPTARHY